MKNIKLFSSIEWIKVYVLLILLIGCIHQSRANGEHFINLITGTPLTVNDSFTVIDDKFGAPEWSDIEQTLSVRNAIIFEIDEASFVLKPQTFTYEVDVQIKLWDAAASPSGSPSNTITETLSISYDTTTSNKTVFKAYKLLEDAHKITVIVQAMRTVGAGWNSMWPPMQLSAEIMIDRKYDFDCGDQPTITSTFAQSQSDTASITWQPVDGAEEYDLEWTFYDSLSVVGEEADHGGPSYPDLGWLFTKNATRVTTAGLAFKIPLLYPDGYVFFRVRAVRYSADGQRETGEWTSATSATLSAYAHKMEVDWHEYLLNWQAQTTFAEEGKHVPSVEYFDGSLRNRQSVTLSNAIDMTIAGQAIYDYQGRPALQVLPAPTFNDLIGFDPLNAAKGAGSTPYTKIDFDTLDCSTSPPVMSTAKGAAKYYSDSNPNSSVDYHQFIPDAEGYPFTITEFTPDQTGRIKRQSGVGADFKLSSGHETKYFYGKPAQIELDRLFGNEVGYASHYLKNMVVDPNGQVSVSYVDAHGRTIATALAGSKPSFAYNDLSSFTPIDTLKRDLLNNVENDYDLTSTYTMLVTNQSDYTFSYSVDSTLLQPNCVDPSICYDCLYDLTITITDNCGNSFNSGNPYVYSDQNFTLGSVVFDTLCSNEPSGIITNFTINNLPIGEYKITKTLGISQEAVNYYVDHFLQQTDCLPDYDELLEQFTSELDFSGCGISCESCLDSLGSESAYINDLMQYIIVSGGTPTAQDTTDAQNQYPLLVEGCEALCSGKNDCEILLDVMRADVSPGGQYALYEYSVDSTGGIFSDDTTSIFFKPSTTYNFQDLLMGDVYRDAEGNPDSIWIDGQLVPPTSLTSGQFLANWKPSWADALVEKYHPEYCYYEWCLENEESNTFDSLLYEIDTFDEAIAEGVVDSSGTILDDPFFDLGANGYDCKELMDSMLLHINHEDTSTYSLTELVSNFVYNQGNGVCTTGFSEGTEADNNIAWQLLRNIYLGLKYQIISRKRQDITGCSNECVGNGETTCNGQPNPYRDKEKRVINIDYSVEDIDQDYINSMIAETDSLILDQCQSYCELNADLWMEQLSGCNLTTAEHDSIRVRLIEVCELGCDRDHPYGASTTSSPNILTAHGDYSFADVLEDELGTEDLCDTLCHSNMITFPKPYNTPQYNGAEPTNSVNKGCICRNLRTMENCYLADTSGYTSFSDFLSEFSDVLLTEAEIDTLKTYCDSISSHYLPMQINIPPYLECGTCKSCPQVEALVTTFDATCSTSNPRYHELRARYLNQALGFSLTPDEYEAFLDTCDVSHPTACNSAIVLCPETIFETAQLDTSCHSILIQQAETEATLAYQAILDSLRRAFIDSYLSQCLTGVSEVFTAEGRFQEYQYTLYYYDQAGNLVKTIAPEGVLPLTTTSALDSVTAHRDNPVNPVKYPDHTFETQYRYNSLNQVVKQISPDADEQLFWYDKVGRVVVSQDGRQAEDTLYSYTRYDEQGRVIEVGEKYNPTAMLDVTARNPTSLESWITGGTIDSRTNVTRTYYDDEEFSISAFGTADQENLRSRVASVTIEAVNDNDNDTYDYATHYSYDVTGNVKTLVQEITALHSYDKGLKRIDYDYDFISGNVHAVFYQKDSIDQFTYRYYYDENNRLTRVETSLVETEPLGSLWDEEATYSYYQHGPLARMEIGEQKVQGMDYAYTLQGWIKGVNSSALKESRDMGLDGTYTSMATQNVARDALGYTLGYFDGDYDPIGGSSVNFELDYASTSFNSAAPSLYNGNIRHMVHDIRQFDEPLGFVYQYDQLHRINRKDAWDGINLTSYEWNTSGSALTKYRELLDYDANGNITEYSKYGDLGSGMDFLNYYYTSNNQLEYIDDSVLPGAYTGDFEDQGTKNYGYDGAGNLINDNQAGASISWTPYGKVDTVTRSAANQVTLFGYDPGQNRVMKALVNTSTSDTTFTYYIRDAQSNVIATYTRLDDTISWAEQHLYGSARLGILKPGIQWYSGLSITDSPYFTDSTSLCEGWKYYEVTNHLGNVLTVVNDRKIPKDVDPDGTADFFLPTIMSATDYYAFGFEMPGRTYNQSDYRYGFNGKEFDPNGEFSSLNHYDYGFRIYNSAIGRFLSVDPLAYKYPSISPYAYVANNPVKLVDPDGRDIVITRISGGGVNGKDLILVTVNAKIIDNTTISNQISALKTKAASRRRGLSRRDSERLLALENQRDYIHQKLVKEVESQLSTAFTGSGNSIDWKFDTNGSSISFASNSSSVSLTDNVLYAVDQLYTGEGPDPQNYGKTERKYSNGSRAELGGLTAYFSLGVDAEIEGPNRVYAHELGHNAGLLHPDVMYVLLNTVPTVAGEKNFEAKFYSKGGNLMLKGSRTDGKLNLEEHQILQIEKMFKSGKLNLGSNQYDPNHAKQGRGSTRKEQMEYIYTPTN